MTERPLAERLFEALTDDSDPGKGIAPAAQGAEAGNFLRHVAALSMTKTADGLADAKLVLSWLMTHLGASSALVGLLVPVREAGSLLPQLFTAARIRAMARRKWAWAGASAVQGLAVLAIAGAGLALSGTVAGLAILIALAVLALARSVASVSYKDVLGKTVAQGRRGAATGLAASVSSGAVVIFALILMTGVLDRFALVTAALALAGIAFLAAAAVFSTLAEEPDAPEDTGGGFGAALGNLRFLRDDPQLLRFVLARGLLTSTALAPPYLVLLAAGAGGEALDGLGAMLLASALAGLVSGAVWGRLSDQSSRRVLVSTGIAGAAGMLLTIALAATGWHEALPVALFGLMLAHQGVRIGRSTYLVDMAPKDRRPAYTAVANTVIGLALLGTGVFGALASVAGASVTLGVFAIMALGGAAVGWTLKEIG